MENTENSMESHLHLIKALNKIKSFGLTSERFKYKDMSNSAEEVTNEAKLNQRSSMKLAEWGNYEYYKYDWCERMIRCPPESINKISVEDYDALSEEDFKEKYERLSLPLIIKGATEKWDASKVWNFEKLYKRFKDSKVKVGEDDSGYKIKIKFKYFLEYLIFNKDDSPLYLFESSIENHKEMKELMQEYSVPKYFQEDLFQLVNEDRRPPYRWFLVGPERSGTAIHKDPLGTSAWNASLVGHKLWLLLPPHIPKIIAKGKEVLGNQEDDEAIMYFKFIFPRIKEKYGDNLKEIFFIQRPGDLVFIPGGWWHVVVNLDDTIAITQNYCNSVNFKQVWRHVRTERKKMAVVFLNKLKKYRPDLYNIAIEMNKSENFKMYSKEQMLSKKRAKKGKSKNKKSGNTMTDDSSGSDSSSSSSLNSSDFE